MKNKYTVLTLLIVFTAVVLSSQTFSQDEPKKQKEQIKNQVKSEVKNQDRKQNQLKNQDQNKNQSKNFIDLNGDGLNDNENDSDRDGIMDSQDSDFVRYQQNTNLQMKDSPANGSGTGTRSTGNAETKGSRSGRKNTK